jgi:hypothetical protein
MRPATAPLTPPPPPSRACLAAPPPPTHTNFTAHAQNTEFTIKLKQLEDELLFKLSMAEGDITEDVALIESLEESKRIATDISEKVAEARETETAINDSRNKCALGGAATHCHALPAPIILICCGVLAMPSST